MAAHVWASGSIVVAGVVALCGSGGCFSDSPTISGGATEAEGTTHGDHADSDLDPSTSSATTSVTSADETMAEGTTEDPPSDTTSGGTTSSGTTEADDTSSGSTGPVAECGNGVAEADELCDGEQLGEESCESLGYVPGTLTCSDECTFEVSECRPPRMVLVPGGEFEMGSALRPDEQPVRLVTVDPFYMDEFEVTVADYTACVDGGPCLAPTAKSPSCNFAMPGRDLHPINCINRAEARVYCEWVNGAVKHLPTEAQWEKAARTDDARTYPWGNVPAPDCTLAVMDDGGLGCGAGSTWEVGSRPAGASAYGGLDMAGNVWEWVDDWYSPTYDPTDLDNPTGSPMGTLGTLRGGGWYHAGFENFAVTYRHEIEVDSADQFIGFRCAQALP